MSNKVRMVVNFAGGRTMALEAVLTNLSAGRVTYVSTTIPDSLAADVDFLQALLVQMDKAKYEQSGHSFGNPALASKPEVDRPGLIVICTERSEVENVLLTGGYRYIYPTVD